MHTGRCWAMGSRSAMSFRRVFIRIVTASALVAAVAWPASAASASHKAASCFGKPVTIKGGQFTDDLIVGTSGPDVINTYDGNDVIFGMGGDDLICTGNGNDIAIGGAGNDKIIGLKGDQTLVGDYSDITVNGISDNEQSGTADGNDLIRGGPGKDLEVGDAYMQH